MSEVRPQTTYWPYLIFLWSPFLFGYLLKGTTIDRNAAVELVLAAMMIGVVVAKLMPWVSWRPAIVTLAVVAGCLTVSVMRPRQAEQFTGSTPAMSAAEAKRDPAAFAKWWSAYLSEVTRTNELARMPDPLHILPYVLRPNVTANFMDGHFHINQLGYRGKDFSRDKGETFRILALGDSVTFGQSITKDSRPWAFALGDLISDRLTCQRPIEVINGGVVGYGIAEGFERLRRDYDWLSPDMALSYFGGNAIGELRLDARYIPYQIPKPQETLNEQGYFNAAKEYLKAPLLEAKDRAGMLLKRLYLVFTSVSDEETVAAVKKTTYYGNYMKLVGFARQHKVKLVLLSFNNAVTPESPDSIIRFYEKPFNYIRYVMQLTRIHNLMIDEIGREYPDVSVVHTGAGLHGHFDEGLYIDAGHFSTKGDALMAENVYQGILPLLISNSLLHCKGKRE
jgi:lysophospholipase L1-like esterase